MQSTNQNQSAVPGSAAAQQVTQMSPKAFTESMKQKTQTFLEEVMIAVGLQPEAVAADTELPADFFERNLRPVLVSRCLECHGPETPESRLRVDSRERLLAEDDGGRVIVPRDVLASRMWDLVTLLGCECAFVQMLWTNSRGRIVYKDVHQVGAVPVNGQRR